MYVCNVCKPSDMTDINFYLQAQPNGNSKGI